MNELIMLLMQYVPLTSDDNPSFVWLIPVVVISLALLVVLIVAGRKRNK